MIIPIPPRSSPPKNQPNALLPLWLAMIGQMIILITVTMIPSVVIVESILFSVVGIIYQYTILGWITMYRKFKSYELGLFLKQ